MVLAQRGVSPRVMSTSAGTLCIRGTNLQAEVFIWGKAALLGAQDCVPLLDIEYDTQLHFPVVRHWLSGRSTGGSTAFSGH